MSIDKQVIMDFGHFLNGIPKYSNICRNKKIKQLAIVSEKFREVDYTVFHNQNYQITKIEEGLYDPQLTVVFTDYSYLESIINNFQWIRDNKWDAIKKFKGNIKVRPRRHYLGIFGILTS